MLVLPYYHCQYHLIAIASIALLPLPVLPSPFLVLVYIVVEDLWRASKYTMQLIYYGGYRADRYMCSHNLHRTGPSTEHFSSCPYYLLDDVYC